MKSVWLTCWLFCGVAIAQIDRVRTYFGKLRHGQSSFGGRLFDRLAVAFRQSFICVFAERLAFQQVFQFMPLRNDCSTP